MAAASVITSIVPNLAISADTYDISWDSVNNKAVYSKNGGATKDILGGGFSSFYMSASSGNTVNVNSGNINTVVGGQTYDYDGEASSNKVIINGGEITAAIIGGNSMYGKVSGNEVTINSGKHFDISGGLGGIGGDGEVSGNKVIINGGEITNIIGGGSNRADGAEKVSNNEVVINGGTVTGMIAGGKGNYGEVKGNIVTYTGGDLSQASIIGWTGISVAHENNTLNIGSDTNRVGVSDYLKIDFLENFDTINFYLRNDVKDNANILTSSADLSNTNVYVFLDNAKGLSKDSKIHLITTSGGLTAPKNAGAEQAGVTNVSIAGLVNVKGYVKLTDSKHLDLTFNGDPDTGGSSTGGSSTGGSGTGGSGTGGSGTGGSTGGATANESAKTLLETKASQSVAINEGANLFVSNLSNIANAANNESQIEAVTFAFASGYDKEITTGSHIDIKSFNANAGIAGNDYFSSGNLTTGIFVEYGKGEYDSFLDDGTTGSGKTEFIGGGAFARFTTLNNFYTEISGRVGKAKTSYETTADYKEFDISNTYYGAHLGLGKIFNLTNSNELDIFARGIWAKTAGNDIVLNGIQTHFDSVTSLRTQVGFKDNIKFSDTSKLYVGATYQYEFDGESKGTLSLPTFGSADIASPKLKGSTGIGEIGYVYETNSIKFEVGAKGYVGKEKGYSGNLGVTFKF